MQGAGAITYLLYDTIRLQQRLYLLPTFNLLFYHVPEICVSDSVSDL